MSRDLKIKRVAIHDQGAFGVLLDEGLPFALSLERTYSAQAGDQFTKIPPGRYLCTRTWYNRGSYWTFEIHVAGHTRILFHKANLEKELDGCIGIGEEFGRLNGEPAILRSGAGFEEFQERFGELDSFYVVIE